MLSCEFDRLVLLCVYSVYSKIIRSVSNKDGTRSLYTRCHLRDALTVCCMYTWLDACKQTRATCCLLFPWYGDNRLEDRWGFRGAAKIKQNIRTFVMLWGRYHTDKIFPLMHYQLNGRSFLLLVKKGTDCMHDPPASSDASYIPHSWQEPQIIEEKFLFDTSFNAVCFPKWTILPITVTMDISIIRIARSNSALVINVFGRLSVLCCLVSKNSLF